MFFLGDGTRGRTKFSLSDFLTLHDEEVPDKFEKIDSIDFFEGLPKFSKSELGRLSIEILFTSGDESNTEFELLVC